ncbi:MAG: LuxR C-terminal-related transcriptional regulator [Propionibacteriaceae bacterium]|nr:LuxR C-terminal-related transcriptional regulator [Propionibacteriaceae bacterium]
MASLDLPTLQRALAPRLGALIRRHTTVFLAAPEAYLPGDLIDAAMEAVHGADGYRHVRLNGEPINVADHYGFGLLLVVPRTQLSLAHEGCDQILEAARTGRLTRVVVVIEDEIPAQVDGHNFSLVLDHNALVATPQELEVMLPSLRDRDGGAKAVHALTGGVASLVLAAEPCAKVSVEETVASAASRWGEDFVEAGNEDELLMLHVCAGRLPVPVFSLLAGEIMGRDVSHSEVRAMRRGGFFVETGTRGPLIPDGLGIAARDYTVRTAPESAYARRAALARAALKNPALGALDRIFLLTQLEDWPALDAVLATEMHLISLLGEDVRAELMARWPADVSNHLPHLAHAVAFLTGGLDLPSFVLGTPKMYQELLALTLGEEPPAEGTAMHFYRQGLKQALPHRVYEREEGLERAEGILAWVDQRLTRLDSATAYQRPEEIMVLVMLSVGAVDALIWLGELNQAYSTAHRALQMTRAIVRQEHVQSLRSACKARLAFLAAKTGLTSTARSWIKKYDEVVHLHGRFDAESATLVRVARRFVDVDVVDPKEQSPRIINPDASFAPFDAEAEAMRAVLMLDEAASSSYLKVLANTTAWSEYPTWSWWPLISVLAVIEARDGNEQAAEAWLEKAPPPEPIPLIIRAYIEWGAGRFSTAASYVNQALGVVDLTSRARALATGLSLSMPGISQDEIDVLYNSVDWADMLEEVVLLPEPARELIVSRLGVQTEKYPGLKDVGKSPEDNRVVELTRRQLEVLKALDSDRTLAEIAKDQFVGLETIRSTAKEVYRRLGVHDRDSAVHLGHAMNLL